MRYGAPRRSNPQRKKGLTGFFGGALCQPPKLGQKKPFSERKFFGGGKGGGPFLEGVFFQEASEKSSSEGGLLKKTTEFFSSSKKEEGAYSLPGGRFLLVGDSNTPTGGIGPLKAWWCLALPLSRRGWGSVAESSPPHRYFFLWGQHLV